MMNADLAAVSKKHGGVGFPLRNRSASSNSGDGRPDPTRYTKYLSLRNRQIVEGKQKIWEDSSSMHTTSLRALDYVQDVQKPLQPILKQTSSRISDLRYRDTSLHKTSSTESFPQEQATRPANHSPLRIKSKSSSKEREHSPTRSGGPIEVYQKEPAEIEYNQQRKDATFSHNNSESAQNFRSVEQQSAKPKLFEKSRQTDPFKSTTDLGTERDFHFDFDQDGATSYVNTTMKSEHLSEYAGTTPKVQHLGNSKPFKPNSTSKKSISAYTEELKIKVEQMSPCKVDEFSEEDNGQDESSGYVIDYEQVLKDNQGAYAPSPTEYRDDLVNATILEQTQEANESDSVPDETSVSSRQQDSPQFRDEHKKEIYRQRKSTDSPVIGGGGDYQSRSRNQSIDEEEEEQPILTFENRQGNLSNMIVPEKQHVFGQNGKSQISSNETTTFRAPQTKKPAYMQPKLRDQRSQHEMSEPEESYTDRTEPIAFKKPQPESRTKKNTLLGTSESHTPTQERRTNFSEIDLVASTQKFKERNKEIDEEFERQSIGSQPPLGNLVVACIIRQPMDTVGVKNKYKHLQSGNLLFSAEKNRETKILATSRTSSSFPITGSIRQGISSSVGPIMNRNHQLNKSANGLDITKSSSFSANRSNSQIRHFSQDSRNNLSAGGTKKKSLAKAGAKDTLPNGYKHPHILTTQIPSKFVLRSPPGLQAQLLNILLKSEQDIKHCQLAFDEYGIQHQAKSRKTMKVFEFDNCVGETKGHSLSMGLDEHVKWITQPQSAQTKAKNVIFLFGQTDALKHQLLNVMQPNSLINQCLKTREIRFLRVSMYHLNQEHLLAHKSFGNKQQMRREIGMELREAFRERDLNAKKIALRLSTYQKTLRAEDVKLGSHLIIQLDDLVFVDLADIDNLKDTSMAKKISADFSVVTNSILTMSPFYKDHDFGKIEEDRLAPYMDTNSFRSGSLTFKNQISRLVTKQSKVLLLCCVIQCSVAGTQAVDYCHKIRTYFHGGTNIENTHFNKTPTRRMQQTQGDISMETDQNVNAFKQLGGLISEVSKARVFIDQVFANKPQGEPLKRMRAQLKDMVSCLRDDVSDLLNSLAANNESYVQQLMKIREMLQIQISYMRNKVSALRSVNRRGSASSNRSGHKICVLPKTMLQQHLSVQVQNNIKPLQSPLYLQQKEKQLPSSTLHNPRPGSQTSLNSGTNGSRPQSSRFNGTQRPSQPALGPRRASRTSMQNNNQTQKTNSFSQSRATTASKNAANFTPQEHRTPAHKNGLSSNIKQMISHESLNNERVASFTRVSESGVSSKGPQRKSSASKASKNKNYSRQQIGSNNGTFTISKNNDDLDKVVSAREQRGPQILEQQSKSYSTQSIAFEGEDFRKQTLQSLNQKYILSGIKTTKTSANVPESTSTPTVAYPLATTELMHQEIFDLKEQLRRATEQTRQAIQLSEEQATKRRQAEEKCIQLTKEVSQKEQQSKDLQERIIAKDQTIRSLESQLDFIKHKNLISKPDSNRLMFTAEDTQNLEEVKLLKKQKAETDQINQEILGQITMLKEAISSFQEQEQKNQIAFEQQRSKDREMEELQAQVKQLMQAQKREPSPNLELLHLRQELQELQQTKEKYREEALFMKQEMRQTRLINPKPLSKERKRSLSSHSRRKESQDKEPLHMHSKLANSQQLHQQDQHVIPQPYTFTQQKSLSTIKNMIRDFKEQRKGLIRTTSSRESNIQETGSFKNQMHGNKTQNHRSSRSRENDEREKFKGYSQLNSHFR